MNNNNAEKIKTAFHPGIYLEEILSSTEETVYQLGARINVSEITLTKLIDGDITLDSNLASKLAQGTGISKQTWINLQMRYNASINQNN